MTRCAPIAARWVAVAALCAWLLPASAAETASPDARESIRFDILEFVVEGNTVLGEAAIDRAVSPFLGPARVAADAEAARKALEKAYQDAGFLSVAVVLPPQQVGTAGGEVRLQVVQAPVTTLRVSGAEHFLPSQVREALPSLAPGSVPDFNQMQAQLAQLARETADREITPIIAAGEVPGTMNVELKVQDKLPLHGSLELNDKQSVNTDAGRLEAALSYDNLFQRGHSVGLNWFYAPRHPRQANIQSLSYHLPLGGPGDRLFVTYTHSDSNTPTPLGGETVSRGSTWRLRWRDALPEREGIDHGLALGLTWRHLRDANADVAGFSTPSPDLRYPSFQLGYDLTVSGSVAGRQSRLLAELSFSLPGLSHREVDCSGTGLVKEQFECKRRYARPGFQVANLTLQHREPLGRWWMSGRLQAQVADQPLIPAEQVTYGGADSVRGYYEGEQSGDYGAAWRLEVGTPSWSPWDRTSLSALAFHDGALLRKVYADASEPAQVHLGSVGLGLRVETTFGLLATLDWAHLLRDTSRTDANGLHEALSGSSAGRGQRWSLSLRQAF